MILRSVHMTLSWVGFGVANSCSSIIFIPSLSSKPVNSVSSHLCLSETFPHWPAAPVRWLFLEGRMFNWLLTLTLVFSQEMLRGSLFRWPATHTHTHTSQAALTRRLQECSTHLWASFYRQHKDQTCKRDTTKTPTFRLKRVGENIRNTCIPSTYTTGYKKE